MKAKARQTSQEINSRCREFHSSEFYEFYESSKLNPYQADKHAELAICICSPVSYRQPKVARFVMTFVNSADGRPCFCWCLFLDRSSGQVDSLPD